VGVVVFSDKREAEILTEFKEQFRKEREKEKK
jgi:hypothetical protein